jgi:hypothetical protein
MPDKTTSESEEPREERDEPELVPAPRIEQPALGAAIGVAAFRKQDDVGMTGDNDEDSHVAPTDNDGETVPS